MELKTANGLAECLAECLVRKWAACWARDLVELRALTRGCAKGVPKVPTMVSKTDCWRECYWVRKMARDLACWMVDRLVQMKGQMKESQLGVEKVKLMAL